MKKLAFIIVLIAGFQAFAQTASQVYSGLEKDLQETSRQIKETKNRQLQEKRDFLGKLDQTGQAVQKTKDETREALNTTQQLAAQRTELDKQLAKLEAETRRIGDILREVDMQFSAEEVITAEKLESALRIMLEKSACADTLVAGTASSPEGKVTEGNFYNFGPASFFLSKDGAIAAPVSYGNGVALPSAGVNLSNSEKEEIRKFLNGEPAIPPVDVTMGMALNLRRTEDTLWQHLKKGGPVMVPIALLAVFALFLAVHKFFALFALPGQEAMELIRRIGVLLGQGDKEAAVSLAGTLKFPLKSLATLTVENADATKDELEEILFQDTLNTTLVLEKHLGVLAVCASAAPLLGLLGTVTGMISTFKLITIFGTGDASMLSSGISEALITTEAGLATAIPALLIHAYFMRKVRRTGTLCQEAAVCLLSAVSYMDKGGSGA